MEKPPHNLLKNTNVYAVLRTTGVVYNSVCLWIGHINGSACKSLLE